MMPQSAPVSEDVAAQLRDLERQGGGMARLAHVCAGLLLFAFSLGSLISISGTAFYRFLAEWDAGHADVPDAISLAVNVLLVLAADVALLYAASVLRVLHTAGAPGRETKLHAWAMIGASILESSTYLYLVWTYDHPTTLFLWAIGITRAVGAPLFAAYLSMARPLPVGPRDVAYQAALAAGKGVVRDVTVLAGDPTAPLERKVKIYTASALMSPHDRSRFDAIISAVSEEPSTSAALPALAAPHPERPPTGGGTPIEWSAESNEDDSGPDSGQMPAVRRLGNARTARPAAIKRRGQRLPAAALAVARKEARETGQKASAFALLDQHPAMPVEQLRSALGCRTETAAALRAAWELERATEQREQHQRQQIAQ